VDEAAAGEEIIIARAGKPIALLARGPRYRLRRSECSVAWRVN
jgi:antitoxin (DNA-binding transcriptional repressor) of toxin-antitoxin stability system